MTLQLFDTSSLAADFFVPEGPYLLFCWSCRRHSAPDPGLHGSAYSSCPWPPAFLLPCSSPFSCRSGQQANESAVEQQASTHKRNLCLLHSILVTSPEVLVACCQGKVLKQTAQSHLTCMWHQAPSSTSKHLKLAVSFCSNQAY